LTAPVANALTSIDLAQEFLDMRYFKLSAAILIGFTFLPLHAGAQNGPSFDCKADRGRTEQAICGDYELRQMDLTMANLYFSIQADNTGRRYRRLKRDQGTWLRERNECGSNVRCLRREYRDRIRELEAALE
jgi:uncharacterized protein